MSTTTSYTNFAYYYNQLIPIDFYKEYANKLKSIKQFNNIIDLACGSGTLCFLLKTPFNQVSGLDISQEMLMIAQHENRKQKKGIDFIQQDLKQLMLPENTFDLVTCTLDSLNYIDDINDIKNIIKNIAQALSKDGYFCFDLLTQFYIDEIVTEYYQCEEINDFEYVWQVDKINDHVIRHDLKILCDKETFNEVHYQYIHDFKIIEQELSKQGFSFEKEFEYSELNELEPSRVLYTCKKG